MFRTLPGTMRFQEATASERKRTVSGRADRVGTLAATVRRGTRCAALFYRICVALGVNEQAAAARGWVPTSRYNRASLTICWPGHLINRLGVGFAAE